MSADVARVDRALIRFAPGVDTHLALFDTPNSVRFTYT